MHSNSRFTVVNEGFTCAHCGTSVPPAQSTCRNHCPHCLHSVHLDIMPGDRAANCGGLMRPIRSTLRRGSYHRVIHQCSVCGHQQPNRVLDEDNPDILRTLLNPE